MKMTSQLLQNRSARRYRSVWLISITMLINSFGIKAYEAYGDWTAYGQTAVKETDYTIDNDKSIYTILTAKGLAWIAWVTNENKTVSTDFPAKAGFEECTLTLANDLDLSGSGLGITNASWVPIGKGFYFSNPERPFKGKFDGKGHQISNLKMTDNTIASIGLFGYLNGATVQNTGVLLSDITFTRDVDSYATYIGGIAGSICQSTIQNCFVGGTGQITITTTASYKGGLNIGGIAGSSLNACTIKNCYATVDISTNYTASEVGGIIGSGSGCTVVNSYATGNLQGGDAYGIGRMATVNSCLALNARIEYNASGGYARVGGSSTSNYATAGMQVFKGDEQITPPINNPHGTDCYFTTNLSFLGGAYKLSEEKLPVLKMLNEDGTTYSDWPGSSQPATELSKTDYLPLPSSWMQVYEANVSTTDNEQLDIWLDAKEDGKDIYHVRTAIGLSWINYVVRSNIAYRGYGGDPLLPIEKGFGNCTIILDNDIDFAANGMGELDWLPIGYNGDEGWSSSGAWVSSGDFKGIFDGDFHTVSNMKITKLGDEKCSTTKLFLGLFGYTRNAQIKNLTVQGTIKLEKASLFKIPDNANIYVGGIAGCIGVNGCIVNCVSNVSIEIADDTRPYDVGGIVGYNGMYIDKARPGCSYLENVYSTGAIHVAARSAEAGGITANNKGRVLNCYSTSDVEAIGTVKGQSTYAGGIVGFNFGKIELDTEKLLPSIQKSFATGAIIAMNNFANSACAGGICGYNDCGTMENCLALNRPKTENAVAVSGKTAGRIAGYVAGIGTAYLTDNYSSTLITLQDKDGIALPKEDKETIRKNGADTYLKTYEELFSGAWGDAWTFSSDGNLPQLKKKVGKDSYTDWSNSGQPALAASDYLEEANVVHFETSPEGGTVSLALLKGEDEETALISGDLVRNKAIVTISTTPEQGYQPTLGYPKVYQTEKSEVTVPVATTNRGKRIFVMPVFPITVEMKYEKLPTNDIRMKSVTYQIGETDPVALPNFSNSKTVYDIVLPANSSGTIKLTGKRLDGGEDVTSTVTFNGTEATTATLEVTSGSATKTYTFNFTVAPAESSIVTIASDLEGGTITVRRADGTVVKPGEAVKNGTELTLSATPLKGYEFGGYTVGENKLEGNTVTVTSGVTISATFTPKAEAELKKIGTPAVPQSEESDPIPTANDLVVIIPDAGALPPDTELSELRLVKDAPTAENQTKVEEFAKEENLKPENLEVMEITLVKIVTTITADGKETTTVTPVQPGDKVKVRIPYPENADKNRADFTVVHLKSDGTTEKYSTTDGSLSLEAEYMELTIASFSPFGIAWTPKADPTPPPYIPTCYNVVLQVAEGVAFNKKAQRHVVEEGSSFSFSLTVLEGYKRYSRPVVCTDRNDETILPRESDGKYILRNVDRDITIRIRGIIRDDGTPTGNEEISSGIRIRTEENTLFLHVDAPGMLSIFTLHGRNILSTEVALGDSQYTLTPGIYLVCVNGKSYKVVIH